MDNETAFSPEREREWYPQGGDKRSGMEVRSKLKRIDGKFQLVFTEI